MRLRVIAAAILFAASAAAAQTTVASAEVSTVVVPVVGAFLIDFTNSLIITAMANWMR